MADPVQVATMRNNVTVLEIQFDSPSIAIEKEEEEYSIWTLVADCGGVLGLFIGFNFLMIWDIIHVVYQRIK